MTNKVEYPKYLYHHSEQPALVLNVDEHDAFGEDWREAPYSEDEPATSVPASDGSDVNLAKLKTKAQLLEHLATYHKLELDPALTNAQLLEKIEEARAAAAKAA